LTQLTPVSADNRRAVVRVAAYEILRALGALSRISSGDVVELLVFTAIWTCNTQHLLGHGPRYAQLHDIPPDSQRRPVTDAELQRAASMPQDIIDRYVTKLIADGLVERVPGGLVAPSAVFTRPEMLDGNNELYARLVSMVAALRGVGFQVGEPN
jgi:hypothetical protein